MNKKKALTVFLVCLLVLVVPVYAVTTIYVEDFEEWEVDLGWTITETYTGNVTIELAAAKDGLEGMNCSATTTGDGAQAFINTTVAQFSGSTSYVGFDVKVIESKISSGMDARVASFGNDIATFAYLEISDNTTDYTWEFNNVNTNETITFNLWQTCVLGVKNTTDGWAALWLNDNLIMNNTADYSSYELCNMVSVGLVNQLVNKDCEVLVDNIIISGDYPQMPFDYNLWFIVTGIITFVFVSGFALFALGRKIR